MMNLKDECFYWLNLQEGWTVGRWCERYSFFDFVGSDEGVTTTSEVKEIGPEIGNGPVLQEN